MCSQSISGARTRKHGDHPHICVLRWLGVPRIFLSAPLSSDAVAFYLSRGAQHLRDGKLATSYLKKVFSPHLEKALTFLDDTLLPATSNAVERGNRRHRKMQKSVYRVRSKVCLEGRIALDMMRESRAEGREQTTEALHQARRGFA